MLSKENCCLIYFKDGEHGLWTHTPQKSHFQEGARFFEFADSTEVIEVVELINKLNQNAPGWNRFDKSMFKEV